ncbi:JAB domain-containing protein [Flavobacterium undicola]
MNLTASEADKQLTQKAKVAGRLLDITLLDSLIIATESYYSFVYKFKL